jgi:tRNA G10  N-methylase Trm11
MPTTLGFATSGAPLAFENGAGTSPNGHRLHPFPARMAPEIVMQAICSVPRGSTILDTMCGSGTVLRECVVYGHQAIGFDIDPLAVLISKVSTRRLDLDRLIQNADSLANRASSLNGDALYLPWIDTDAETRRFTEFWFGSKQRSALRALASLILHVHGPVGDALRLALSKIIITKEPRASLARDTSHSRPHRVILSSAYDVIQGFQKAALDIADKLSHDEFVGSAEVRRADARRLPLRLSNRAHLAVTSPPYGNAIDYLRGHGLALVWLGYSIPRIRAIKAANIGRQTGTYSKRCRYVSELAGQLGLITELQPATRRRLFLFVQDMLSILQEIYRSLLPGGRAVLVVGNSLIDGQLVDNARMIAAASELAGLKEIARYSREIPRNHRYLPPPHPTCNSPLGKRMKEEVVLTFEKME